MATNKQFREENKRLGLACTRNCAGNYTLNANPDMSIQFDINDEGKKYWYYDGYHIDQDLGNSDRYPTKAQAVYWGYVALVDFVKNNAYAGITIWGKTCEELFNN